MLTSPRHSHTPPTIVDMLSRGERCVCELREAVGATFPPSPSICLCSKRRAFWSDDKRGLQVYYRLRCTCVMNFFGCIEGVLRENAKKQLALINE